MTDRSAAKRSAPTFYPYPELPRWRGDFERLETKFDDLALQPISVGHKLSGKAPGGPTHVPPVTELLPPSPHTPAHDIVREGIHGLARLVSRSSLRSQLGAPALPLGPGKASRPVGLKYTDGSARIWPTRWLPLGTAYAFWTDVCMVGTALLGMLRFP
jgi:hypothetical protein